MSSRKNGPLAIEFTVDSSHPYAMYADPVNAIGGHDEVPGHLADDFVHDKHREHDDSYARNSLLKDNR